MFTLAVTNFYLNAVIIERLYLGQKCLAAKFMMFYSIQLKKFIHNQGKIEI